MEASEARPASPRSAASPAHNDDFPRVATAALSELTVIRKRMYAVALFAVLPFCVSIGGLVYEILYVVKDQDQTNSAVIGGFVALFLVAVFGALIPPPPKAGRD
jgi:hypothetical protein